MRKEKGVEKEFLGKAQNDAIINFRP